MEETKQEIPVIKCESQEIVHPDGRKEVVINVPLLELQKFLGIEKLKKDLDKET